MQTDIQTLIESIAGIWVNCDDKMPDTFTTQPLRIVKSGTYVDPFDYYGADPLEKFYPEQLEWLDPSTETKSLLLSLLENKQREDVSDDAWIEDYKKDVGSLPFPVNNLFVEAICKDAINHVRSQQSTQIEELQKENEVLKNWKGEAIAVMPDYQAIGKLLKVPLGQSIHDKIIPAIEELKQQIKDSEDRINDLITHNTRMYKQGYDAGMSDAPFLNNELQKQLEEIATALNGMCELWNNLSKVLIPVKDEPAYLKAKETVEKYNSLTNKIKGE